MLYYNLAKQYNEYAASAPFISNKIVPKCQGRPISIQLSPQRSPIDLDVFERKVSVGANTEAKAKYVYQSNYDNVKNGYFDGPENGELVAEIASMMNLSMYDILKSYFEIRLSEERIKMTSHNLKQNLLKLKKKSRSFTSGLKFIDRKISHLQPSAAFSLDISQKNGTLITSGAPVPQGPSGGPIGGGGY